MHVFQIPMHTFASNCYVVESEKKTAAVIDPGNESAKIIATLKEKGITPVMILLTHGHFDHVGAVADLIAEFGCKVMISKEDECLVLDQNLGGGAKYHRIIKSFPIDEYLHDGQKIEFDGIKMQVMATPGHTKGGVSIICGEYIFTGDTLFNLDIGRSDLYGGNYNELLASVRKLTALNKNYIVLPGHEEYGMLFDQRSFVDNLPE